MIITHEDVSLSTVTTSSIIRPESRISPMYEAGMSGPTKAHRAVGHPSLAAETAMFGPVPPSVVLLLTASAVMPGGRNLSMARIVSMVTCPYTDR